MNTQPDQKAVAATGDFEGAIQEALTRIQSIYELVPDFQFTPREGIQSERTAKTVSDEFFEATITSVNASSQLKDSTALDSDAVRVVSQRNLRFEAVATAAEALARNVRFNMLRERWDVAKEALHVYDVAKSLVRPAAWCRARPACARHAQSARSHQPRQTEAGSRAGSRFATGQVARS